MNPLSGNNRLGYTGSYTTTNEPGQYPVLPSPPSPSPSPPPTKLESSSELYQSCYEDEPMLLINNEEPIATLNTNGSIVITQLNELREAAILYRDILLFAHGRMGRLTTAGVSIATGLASLATLSPIGMPIGAWQAGVGVLEIRNMIQEYKGYQKSDALLNNARGAIRLIRMQHDASRHTITTVQNQLHAFRSHLEEIETRVGEIHQLATGGSADAERSKREAEKLAQAAVTTNRQALYYLESSSNSSENVIASLQELQKKIEKLLSIAESTSEAGITAEDMNAFVAEIDAILGAMGKTLNEANSAFTQLNLGISEFTIAVQLNNQSSEKYREAFTAASNALRAIERKTEIDKLQEAQKIIQNTQNHMGELRSQNEEAQRAAEYADANLEALQKKMHNKSHKRSWTVLAGSGGLGAVLLGPTWGIILGGALGGTLYTLAKKHIRVKDAPTITSAATKTQDSNAPENPVRVSFNPTSTGYAGYALGLLSIAMGGKAIPSKTVGTCKIKVGDKIVTCPFNRNSGSELGKMDLEAMLLLRGELNRALSDNTITPEECLSFLKLLENFETENGHICMIVKDCWIFQEIRKQCENAPKNSES